MFLFMLIRLTLVLAILVWPGLSHADDVLDPVVVTFTRLPDVPEPIRDVPGKVIIITAEEITTLGARTVQEALQYQSGVVLFDSVGNEFQQTIDLRGFNGQPVTTTSVFVDGVRVNEPDFNTINFDLIPIETIERIEILPGTATVFGRNALGGAINITTKRGSRDRPHFGFDIGGGSFARQRYSFNSDGPLPLKNFDYFFSVTRELTDGFREERDDRMAGARLTRIFGKLGYKLGDQTDISLAYTRILDHISQAGSLPGDRLRLDRNDNLTPGDFSAADLHQIALNIKQKLPAGFSFVANAFARDSEQKFFVQGLSSTSRFLRETFSAGTTLQASHDGTLFEKKNLLILGFEYARNRFNIDNSGLFLPAFMFQNLQSTREDVIGVYLTDSIHLSENVVVNAALRYDWDHFDFTDKLDPSLDGTKTYQRLNPKAGIVYTPIPAMNFSFSYSEGVRIPTVSEIFAQGPFGSNPNLVTMKSRNFELGAKFKLADWLETNLALFYMPVRDEILFVVTDPVNFFGNNENISRTLRRGMEWSLKARYRKWLDGFINYTVTKATFESDVLLFSGQVRKGNELPLVPRHRASVGINTYPIEGLTVSLFGNYVGEQYLIGDEPNQAKKLTDNFVLNSRVAYQWKNWTGYINVNNLTNQKYSTSGVITSEAFRVPAPGANFFAGMTFRY